LACYYKSCGRDPAGDNLLAMVDFGRELESVNSDWTLSASTLLIRN
jgi:hypothetical protein